MILIAMISNLEGKLGKIQVLLGWFEKPGYAYILGHPDIIFGWYFTDMD